MADAYVGEIRMFAGNYAPQGWALCDGSLLPVNGNEALYALIGNTYGGTASQNFAVPDLRSRLAMGEGQGTTLTPRAIGQALGSETVTLTPTQLPMHNHSFLAATNGATQTTPTANLLAAPAPATNLFAAPNPAKTTNNMADDMVGFSGAQQALPHNNMMPSLSVAFIICVNGLYPTQQ